MTSDVFRPSNGPLLVRGNIATGMGESADSYRKNRPDSQGGYRFGQLSHNSFFARHNPHPSRVRHLKGLLDVPICSVHDDGYLSNPRYSLNFPPNNHDDTKISDYSKYYNIPVNAINVNSQRHPINTITGLQYFQGKPLNMRIFREKAVPRVGMVPVTDSWRDELLALTEAIKPPPATNMPQISQQQTPKPGTAGKPRTSQYSAETGRLIPPPSRAMSRGGPSRGASRGQENFISKLQHISDDPDLENQILLMLCQILQTEDINAVKAWLVNGSDREKEQVLGMIRGALEANDQYYRQERKTDDVKFTEDLGKTLGDADNTDRLTLDGDEERPMTANNDFQNAMYRSPTGLRRPSSIQEEDEATKPPVLPDIFKAPNSASGGRPRSTKPRTPSLKYTRVATPQGADDDQRLQAMMEDKHHVWEPNASVALQE